jgi:cytochrome oxidase Cu insertion factor (SCO1/SenC/PrrC family)
MGARVAAWLAAGPLGLALGAAASAHEGHGADDAPALAYELPAAGSYELPPIQRVTDRVLLGSDARSARLLDLAPGQLAVVSFTYLGCRDPSGCPLALATLVRLDRALAARPELARRVRIVSVSFDPARDRPADLARLREGLGPRADWRFLTAPDAEALAPVLAEFGQEVDALPAEGEAPSALGHVLKVYLVDSQGRVRNVYSAGFLDHRLLLRDVETVLREPAASPGS